MTKLKIYYHDGSIQVCSPKMEGENKFNGDWKGLAETVAGKMYHGEHAYYRHAVI
jgi:hypothetical protein